MNRRNLFCLIVALSIISAAPVLAEVPHLVNYQGIILDSGGQPVTTSVNVIFAIWDDPAAGDSLWSEQQTITPGTDGSFSILLGSVSQISDVVFAGTDAYLSIKVESDPEMTPRRRIVSAGYAHRVSTVDGSSGGTVNGDISISGGDLILENSTGATGNIIKGGFRFIHDFGAFNTFIGTQAGNFTMSGNTNTACGYAVLNNNTSGVSNTGTGASALNSNLGGSNNTANGAFALQYNNTGHDNTAIGHFALRNNTIGHNNTASGAWALAGNTEGFENTANGYEALYSNTTGKGNTASGYLALRSNTLGLYNAAGGYQALTNNTEGSYNTASGYQSLSQNIDGSKNTAYGSHTLRFNTTGYFNTASGSYALENNSSGQRNTASGCYALVDNTLGYDNTAAGFEAMHNNTTGFENTASGVNALYNNSTGNYNTAHGFDALKNNTGDNNTACGYRALQSNSTGSGNTAIGTYAGVSPGTLTNATAIGYGASVDASNKIRLGNSSVSVIEGQVAFTFTSDRNEKENFRPVDGDDVLQKVRGLDLPSWNYIGQNPQQFRHYGPVAQEFFAAFGHDEVGTIGTSTTINSGDMLGILMIAVQALEKRTTENKDLQLRITNLQTQNEEQDSQIAELRNLIDQLLAQKR